MSDAHYDEIWVEGPRDDSEEVRVAVCLEGSFLLENSQWYLAATRERHQASELADVLLRLVRDYDALAAQSKSLSGAASFEAKVLLRGMGRLE